jgi:hypothetical protein
MSAGNGGLANVERSQRDGGGRRDSGRRGIRSSRGSTRHSRTEGTPQQEDHPSGMWPLAIMHALARLWRVSNKAKFITAYSTNTSSKRGHRQVPGQ